VFQTPARPQAVPVPSSSSSKLLQGSVFRRVSAEDSSSLTIALEMGTAEKVFPGVLRSATCTQTQISNGKSSAAQKGPLSPKASFRAMRPERQFGLCTPREQLCFIFTAQCANVSESSVLESLRI